MQWFEAKKRVDGFVSSSRDVNWWTGVVWIIVMFYQLFGLSFWRHPFTAKIHFWASDAMLHFSKSVLMKKQTHLHLGWPERVHFKHITIFGWTVPLNLSKHFFYSEASIFNNNFQMHLDFSNCSWFLYSSVRLQLFISFLAHFHTY